MHFFLKLNLLIHVLAQLSIFLKKNAFRLHFLNTKFNLFLTDKDICNKTGQPQTFGFCLLVFNSLE